MLAALTLTMLPAGAASKIYKTFDEDGNVVFTDVAPKTEQPNQPVELEPPNSFTPPPDTREGISLEEWLGTDGEVAGEAAATGYQSLAVGAPGNDEGLRDNAGNVTVRADLIPELAQDHALQVYLDGTLMETSNSTTVELINIDRGTHNVQLRVVDAAGSTLISSAPSVFHLQRRSVINQPASRAPTR
jgi:hypothetical protein